MVYIRMVETRMLQFKEKVDELLNWIDQNNNT